MSRSTWAVLAVIVVFALAAATLFYISQQDTPAAPDALPTTVGGSQGQDSIEVADRVEAVDGDTLRVSGDKVRVIGIDTPERGECGYAEASRATDDLVAAGVKLIRPAGEPPADKYGRQLRYVRLADNRDLGLILIKLGLAQPRYDSRDGYPAHPLEDEYHELAARTNHKCPDLDIDYSPPDEGTTDGCDPSYDGACVPVVQHDLDCSDIAGPVTVVGPDRHRLDGDGDGTACS